MKPIQKITILISCLLTIFSCGPSMKLMPGKQSGHIMEKEMVVQVKTNYLLYLPEDYEQSKPGREGTLGLSLVRVEHRAYENPPPSELCERLSQVPQTPGFSRHSRLLRSPVPCEQSLSRTEGRQ